MHLFEWRPPSQQEDKIKAPYNIGNCPINQKISQVRPQTIDLVNAGTAFDTNVLN